MKYHGTTLWTVSLLMSITVTSYAKTSWDINKVKNHLLLRQKKNNRVAIPDMLPIEYDSLYPYYFKYCSTTKFHPSKGKGIEGGIAGHAVFYLKGVCKNSAYGPSGLSLCPLSANYDDSQTGVGLSVDKGLKNVNFFVFPGRELFLFGNVEARENFTYKTKQLIVEQVLKQGVFDGIKMHSNMFPVTVLPCDRKEYMAYYVFGTDYALTIARNLYCINIPLTRSLMGMIVNALNQLNASYKTSKDSDYRGVLWPYKKKDNYFHWHGIYDNCTHTIIEVLSKIGLLKFKKINYPLIIQMFNVAIPANTYLDIYEKTNSFDIDVDTYYRNLQYRKIFLEHEWIPQQDGAFAELIAFHRDNSMFIKNDSMFVWPALFENYSAKIRKQVYDPLSSYQGEGLLGFLPNMIMFVKKYYNALEKVTKRQQSKYYHQAKKNSDPVVMEAIKQKITLTTRNLSNDNLSTKNKNKLDLTLRRLRKDLSKRIVDHQYVAFVEKFGRFLQKKIEYLEFSIALFYQQLRLN